MLLEAAEHSEDEDITPTHLTKNDGRCSMGWDLCLMGLR